MPVTCIALSNDESTAFTGSKDCSIICWDIETGKKTTLKSDWQSRKQPSSDHKTCIKGHTDHILSVSSSSDGKFLASGSSDRTIRIWDLRSHTCIQKFSGHRGAVSCLSFQDGENMLFSGSHDRTVKVWNMDAMAYVETLFGHQSEITSISCLHQDRPISSSTDRTLRLWKVMEESQLIYRGHKVSGSIDCVTYVNEKAFISGAEDGSISLWATAKKKPVTTIPQAHSHGPGCFNCGNAIFITLLSVKIETRVIKRGYIYKQSVIILNYVFCVCVSA